MFLLVPMHYEDCRWEKGTCSLSPYSLNALQTSSTLSLLTSDHNTYCPSSTDTTSQPCHYSSSVWINSAPGSLSLTIVVAFSTHVGHLLILSLSFLWTAFATVLIFHPDSVTHVHGLSFSLLIIIIPLQSQFHATHSLIPTVNLPSSGV